MSIRIASRFRAVSSSVSPFTVEEADPEMLTESADSRLAAISNDVRVRVDVMVAELDEKTEVVIVPKSSA